MKTMNKTYGLFLTIILALFALNLQAQNPKKFVRKGNKNFEKGNFQEAEVEYRKALSTKKDYDKAKFNLGDAMYEQKNMEEAGKLFSDLAQSAKSPEIKSEAWYNYGNTLMAQKKYKEAMQAFKKALLLNPHDQAAKYNYEYARKKMIQQQKQQQQKKQQKKNNKNQKNKDKQKQDQKNKKDKKDQNKDKQDQQKKQDQKNKEQKQNQDQEKQQGDQQKQNQQQKRQPQQISKKDAQRMLDALKNDEKKTLRKLQKKKAKAVRAKKSDIDW
jgi:tetratricopeptide (TPR) repeat protein